MDQDAMFRHQALNVAQASAEPGAKVEDLLAAAERVYAWLSQSAKTEAASQPAQVHESQKA